MGGGGKRAKGKQESVALRRAPRPCSEGPRASREPPGRGRAEEWPLRRAPSPARRACVHFRGATNPPREPICSEE